jgi:hypothetical protein
LEIVCLCVIFVSKYNFKDEPLYDLDIEVKTIAKIDDLLQEVFA